MMGEGAGGGAECVETGDGWGYRGGHQCFGAEPVRGHEGQMQVMSFAAHAGLTSAGGMTSTTTRKYRGTMDCFLQTVRNEGIIKGLYRDQTTLFLCDIPENFW